MVKDKDKSIFQGDVRNRWNMGGEDFTITRVKPKCGGQEASNQPTEEISGPADGSLNEDMRLFEIGEGREGHEFTYVRDDPTTRGNLDCVNLREGQTGDGLDSLVDDSVGMWDDVTEDMVPKEESTRREKYFESEEPEVTEATVPIIPPNVTNRRQLRRSRGVVSASVLSTLVGIGIVAAGSLYSLRDNAEAQSTYECVQGAVEQNSVPEMEACFIDYVQGNPNSPSVTVSGDDLIFSYDGCDRSNPEASVAEDSLHGATVVYNIMMNGYDRLSGAEEVKAIDLLHNVGIIPCASDNIRVPKDPTGGDL